MKRFTLIALVVVAAAVPTLAQATVIPYLSQGVGVDNASYTQTEYRLGPGEIPYLSQGIGVDEESYSGSASTAQKPVEIPYLSQGVGVTSAELFGVGSDDRAFSRETSPGPTPAVASGTSAVDFGNGAAISLLLMGLFAGGAAVAIWNNRRGKLSPA